MPIGSCRRGAVSWTLAGDPGPATACSCALRRRHGTLWAYDRLGGRIAPTGPTTAYRRADRAGPWIESHSARPAAACSAGGLHPEPDGRRRMTANPRLAPPEAVADLPIDHFDGLASFDDLPRNGRCVRDLWF